MFLDILRCMRKTSQLMILSYGRGIYLKNMETLFVWCSCWCVYRPQESSICVYSKRFESPTKNMVRIIEGLWHMCSHVEEAKKHKVKDVHKLAWLCVRLEDSPNGGFMVHRNSESSLVIEVKSKKHLGQPLIEFKKSFFGKFNESLSLGGGVLRYQGRLCVTNVDDFRKQILEEARGSLSRPKSTPWKLRRTLG